MFLIMLVMILGCSYGEYEMEVSWRAPQTIFPMTPPGSLARTIVNFTNNAPSFTGVHHKAIVPMTPPGSLACTIINCTTYDPRFHGVHHRTLYQ